MRLALGLGCLLAVLPPAACAAAAVYIDKGACPFECCKLGAWKATKGVALVDRVGGRRLVHRIKPGEAVEAVTAELHTVPQPMKIARTDANVPALRPGDAVEVVSYEGEGFWSVRRGKDLFQNVHDSVFPRVPEPKRTWWVKIAARRATGWAKDPLGSFDGQDDCD